MRTVDEIKEKYLPIRKQWEEAQPQHALQEAMPWLGYFGEIWLLLDHIAELEAQNAALQAQVERIRAHVPDWELRYWGDLPDESPTAAVVAELEREDGVCPVCGGTGWIQEGWGDYNIDGIPCLACEEQ